MIITWLEFIKNMIITLITNKNKCGKPEKTLQLERKKKSNIKIACIREYNANM